MVFGVRVEGNLREGSCQARAQAALGADGALLRVVLAAGVSPGQSPSSWTLPIGAHSPGAVFQWELSQHPSSREHPSCFQMCPPLPRAALTPVSYEGSFDG